MIPGIGIGAVLRVSQYRVIHFLSLSGGKGRGRGRDHRHWPDRSFTGHGLVCLQQARAAEPASLRQGANH